MRNEIDLLLLELWQDERCKSCIRQQATGGTAGGSQQLFAGFVSAVLNDLMYLFKDSLERLADIKQIEDSKKDSKVGMCGNGRRHTQHCWLHNPTPFHVKHAACKTIRVD